MAIAGASAYFMGGAVVYTRQSRTALLEVTEQELTGITPSTEAYALLFARKIRGKLATTWSVGETGTAGPTGSRYGHAAGHSCIAVIGPNGERSITVETGKSDRVDNMRAFSIAALDLLEKAPRLGAFAGLRRGKGGRLLQLGQLVPDPRLVNDRRFDAGHSRPAGKAVERQVFEVLHIARDDMHDEIVASGNQERRAHLGDLGNLRQKAVHSAPFVL